MINASVLNDLKKMVMVKKWKIGEIKKDKCLRGTERLQNFKEAEMSGFELKQSGTSTFTLFVSGSVFSCV